MLTPQAIKDQEFQVKFRGYDPIEVKSYLELLAEDFFELLEQNRVNTEEIESFVAEQELLQLEKEKLENELRVGQVSRDEIAAEIKEELSLQEDEVGYLKNQIEDLKATAAKLEDESSAYREKIAKLEEQLNSGSDAITKEQHEIKRLQNKIERVEERNRELEKEGFDFKTTILAAQKFADNLRENSERDARSTIEQAKAEVEKIRNEARQELTRLPRKIEELQQKKNQVRDELKVILENYMAGLDASDGSGADAKEDDIDDLFQKIQLPGGENGDLENSSVDTELS